MKPLAIRQPAKPTLNSSKARAGRRAGAGKLLDRPAVFAAALELAKACHLSELSVVLVARELGVTPALIHYYVGGRGALTSGVMNAFWKDVVEAWPPEDGSWQHNIESVAHAFYDGLLRFPGVTSYVASHNRYRLVQDVEAEEIDYGIRFFEKFVTTVRQAGFDAAHTAAYSHLLVELVISHANATVGRQWPGQHAEFLNQKLAELDPQEFPSTHFVRENMLSLNASDAFKIGLQLMLQALEANRVAGGRPASGSASATAGKASQRPGAKARR